MKEGKSDRKYTS